MTRRPGRSPRVDVRAVVVLSSPRGLTTTRSRRSPQACRQPRRLGTRLLSLRLHHRCATSTTRRLLLAGSARTKTRKRQPGPTPIPMEPYLVCARPHDLPEHAVAADVRQLVGVRGEVRLRAGVRVVPGFMTLIRRAAPPRVATEKPSPSVWICATYCTVRGDAEGAKADACPRCSATICIGVRTAGTNRNASGWCRPPTREPGPRRAR